MLFTVNTKESPAEMRSLPATLFFELSRMIMSCEIVPELTTQKTTFPLEALRVDGVNEYSVIVTLIDPAGGEPPPPLPPHPASRATAATAATSALIGKPSRRGRGCRTGRARPRPRSASRACP